MTVKNVLNIAASVQARLQNHARASKRPFQELLQYHASPLGRTAGKARVAMQIDVGFGDVVTPGAVDITYPALLDFQAPRSRAIRAKPWSPRSSRRRETAIDVAPIAFTPEFTEQASTNAQWTAFRKRLPNAECPETLADVVPILAEFLLPIARACESPANFEARWPPGGPWTTNA